MVQYDLNIRDYWRILRKRKYIVISAVFLVTFLSFIFSTLQRPIPLYRSSVSVKIEENTTFTGIYLQALAFSSADTLETQTVIIKSYPVMEEVAKRLGSIDASLTSREIRADNELLGKVLSLKNKITTEREGNTNIINIYAVDRNPQMAQKLAATVAEVYKDINTQDRNKRVFEARRFIEEQLRIVKGKLKESEEKVRQFRESHGMMSLDVESTTLASRISELESRYRDAKRAHENLKGMIAQLERKEAVTADTLQALVGESPSPVFSSLNNKLLNLTLQRDTLLLDFTEKHPEVEEVNKQIDEVVESMLKEVRKQEETLALKAEQYLKESEELKKRYAGLPQEGLEMARLEREVKLNEDIVSQLEAKYQEVLIREAEKIEEVTIVRPALEPTRPINPPRKGATTAIGFLLGIVIGVIFAFLKESLDTSIGTIADVEEYLDLPVLGIISYTHPENIFDDIPELADSFEGAEDGTLVSLASLLVTDSTIAENFRALEANVQYISAEKDVRVLMVTASTMEEGKTLVASNLAVTFAVMNYKTLLIDGDLRKPDIHRIFGLNRESGLSDAVLGTSDWREVRNTINDMILGRLGVKGVMSTHGIDNLHVITAGTNYANPMRLLSSDQMKQMIQEFKVDYDIIIVDSPPILQSSDPIILAERVDAVLLVYKVGSISRGLLKRAKDQLDNVKSNTLGVILNQLRAEVSPDFQEHKYYYQYSYTYGAGEGKKKRTSALARMGIRGKAKKGEGPEGAGAGRRGIKVILMVIALLALIAGLYWNR
jgi:capsular exopolysaccharide synthesis family protein